MSSYEAVKGWFSHQNVKVQAGLLTAIMLVVGASVFGIMPQAWLLNFNIFLSACVWMICVGIVLLGGNKVEIQWYAGAAFLAAGLTTSIPSIPYLETPVSWGSSLSRLGVLIWAISAVNHLYSKYREEKRKSPTG